LLSNQEKKMGNKNQGPVISKEVKLFC